MTSTGQIFASIMQSDLPVKTLHFVKHRHELDRDMSAIYQGHGYYHNKDIKKNWNLPFELQTTTHFMHGTIPCKGCF